MPLLAVSGGVAAASLAGLPLTIGFFKDEALFTTALHKSWFFAGLMVLGASFTLAYTWRFWAGLFLGRTIGASRPLSFNLMLPILVTGVAFLVKGYASPGDGFSGGVIAASGVLLQYVAFGYRRAERSLPVRYAPAAALGGLAAALIIAFAPLLGGEPILTHQPEPGSLAIYLGTVELVGAFAFDVAIFVLVFGFVIAVITAIAGTSTREER